MMLVTTKELRSSCTDAERKLGKPQPRVCSHVCHGIDSSCERLMKWRAQRARGIDFASLGAAVTKLTLNGKVVRLARMLDEPKHELKLAA